MSDDKYRLQKKYDSENIEQVKLRVPAGLRQQMQDYVDTLPEYENSKGAVGKDGKKHHSVNAWLLDLIMRELNSNS